MYGIHILLFLFAAHKSSEHSTWTRYVLNKRKLDLWLILKLYFRLLLGGDHTNITTDALLLLLFVVLYVFKRIYTNDGSKWQFLEPRPPYSNTMCCRHFLCVGLCGRLGARYASCPYCPYYIVCIFTKQTPLINMFSWSKLLMLSLGIITFIFSMIAISDVGFPYRAKTSVMRVNFLVSVAREIRKPWTW